MLRILGADDLGQPLLVSGLTAVQTASCTDVLAKGIHFAEPQLYFCKVGIINLCHEAAGGLPKSGIGDGRDQRTWKEDTQMCPIPPLFLF